MIILRYLPIGLIFRAAAEIAHIEHFRLVFIGEKDHIPDSVIFQDPKPFLIFQLIGGGFSSCQQRNCLARCCLGKVFDRLDTCKEKEDQKCCSSEQLLFFGRKSSSTSVAEQLTYISQNLGISADNK